MRSEASTEGEGQTLEDLAQAYSEALQRLARDKKKFDEVLSLVRQGFQGFAEAEETLSLQTQTVSDLKQALSDKAREARSGIRCGTISVKYSDPVSVSYDAVKLLEIYPAAAKIPNLIGYTVNNEIMEAAVAAEFLSEETEKLCRVETRKTSTGRVTINQVKETT